MKSIQTKLTVTILVIFFVALSVLGGLNYWKARSIITASVTQDMAGMAVTSAGDIGDWLEARKAIVNTVANSPAILSGDAAAILPVLVAAVKANPDFDTIVYGRLDGSTLNSLGVTGNNLDRAYFQSALKGETVVTDPALTRTTQQLATTIAIPVKIDGKVVAVVFGGIKMDDVAKKVLAIKVGQTGYAMVTQGDGLRIIHPDKELAMKSNPLKDQNAEPNMKQLTELMVKGEKGLATYTSSNGISKYYAFAPVPGTKWSLAVAAPVDEVSGAVAALTTITLITIVIVLIIAGLMISWYARRLARPIREIEIVANRIADGDIRAVNLNITSNDEIGRLGQSFEKMTANLRTLIQKITAATDQVAASSEELTASAEQSAQAANQVAIVIGEVAAGAEKQLKAVDDTSVIVGQMAAGAQQIAANANTVAGASGHTAEAAQEGGKAVDKAISQMGQIEQTVTRSSAVVAKLGERSKEIGQIVDTIAGIAGQTNLLALNAAIEAARAGEQGRGFAVVAEEVRKLAEQSQTAAKQIASLIGEIRSDTDSAVAAMGDGAREVRIGTEVVNNAGQSFWDIFTSVNDVTGQVREISAAIEQMAAGSQQIVAAVKDIDIISKDTSAQAQTVSAATEEQSASMEEIAASSQALSKLAAELMSAVGKFKI